jgi:hypothetical protein
VKRLLSVLVTFLLLVIPAEVFAKAETSKITIKGADLRVPIEITDPKTLANFSVWTGPGTSCTGAGCPERSARQAESFIVDWSQAVAEPPSGLQRYEVSFYAKTPKERLIYVVFYEYDAATEHGYIYFPGRTEEWYRLNVSTIFHGVEGKWFRAWSVWESVARPLILKATSYPHVISQPPSIFNIEIIGDPPFPPADLPLNVPLHRPKPKYPHS